MFSNVSIGFTNLYTGASAENFDQVYRWIITLIYFDGIAHMIKFGFKSDM